MVRNYEDLEVYRKSYQLALEMYKTANQMPKEEAYGLASQIKRASISIPLNIAEGYGKRESVAEFKRFLQMAKGSCDEMKVLTDFMKDIGVIAEKERERIKGAYDEVGKMLYGLIKRWQ